MSLFRRGKIWWYSFRFAGRRYRESSKSRSKVLAADAERQRRRELEESFNGITARRKTAPLAFSAAAERWLELNQPTWAKKTHVIANTDVRHLREFLAGKLVTDIAPLDIAAYITHRRAGKAAEKTIRNELGTLRGILKTHKLWARLKEDGVRLPRLREAEVGVALSPEQERRLLMTCAASRSRSLLPAVTLALATGLRYDELRNLRWRDIDLVNAALKVRQSKTEHGTGRAVPLNQTALATVREWASSFPERKAAHYVFPSERVGFSGNAQMSQVFDTNPEKPITSWKVAWTTARKAAGVTCRFHDLRHTTCTRLLGRGQAFAIVASIMGWSPATTVRMVKRYGHIGSSAQRAAMASLDVPTSDSPEKLPWSQTVAH